MMFPARQRVARGALTPPTSSTISPLGGRSANSAASREAGMNEHITKPLDIPRLMDALSRWLPETEL